MGVLPVAGHPSRSGRVLNYPGRCAGVGLLLLRVTVGVTVAIQGWLSVASTNADLLGAIPAAVLVVCGVALTIGIFTPVCSTLVGLGYALVLFTPFDGAVLPRVDGGSRGRRPGGRGRARVCSGPAPSLIDCRLFGRREIFIPAKDRSE